LQGKMKKDEILERMILENQHYAKRQMTWFKKYAPKTKWISSNLANPAFTDNRQ